MQKETLKVLRARVDMTQGEVAEKVGVDRNTYSKWERYKCYPDARQLIKLSFVFNCPLDGFYFPVDAN